MTFISHKIFGDDPVQGDYNVRNNHVGYDVNYTLTCDDASDEAQLAIAYVQTAIANWGDSYRFANGRRDSALLQNIRARRAPKDNFTWFATLRYEDPDENEQVGNDGLPNDNPLDWRPVVDVSTVQYSRGIQQAEYLTGFKQRVDNIIKTRQQLDDDGLFPVCNSNIVPLDPPPEGDHSRTVISVRRNVATAYLDTLKNNIVNSEEINLNYRGLTKRIRQYTGKTRNMRCGMNTYRASNGALIDYLDLAIEVEVYDDGDETWRLRPIDKGFERLGIDGDPDGKGGFISPGEKVKGKAQQERITDMEGNYPSREVLLDGDGNVYALNATSPELAIVSTWRYYIEDNLASWPVFQGIFY